MPVPVSSAMALRCLVGTKCYSITFAVSITAEQPQFTRESSENSPPPPLFSSLLPLPPSPHPHPLNLSIAVGDCVRRICYPLCWKSRAIGGCFSWDLSGPVKYSLGCSAYCQIFFVSSLYDNNEICFSA